MADGEFDNLTINNILTFDPDVTLYRSGTNTLKTDDQLVVGSTLYHTTEQILGSNGSHFKLLNTTGTAPTQHVHFMADYVKQNGSTDVTLFFGYDSEIKQFKWQSKWGGSNNNIMTLDYTGQLQLPTQGSNGGILLGGDAQLYRSSTNTLSITESDGSTPANLTLNSALLADDVPQIDVDELQFPSPYKNLNSLGYGNILFKHTGSQHNYPDDVYTSLFLVMVQDPAYPNNYLPILATDHGLWVEKDIQTYGALFTSSDPGKGSGGGAIMMGHGFKSATAHPEFILTDTTGGGSGATATLTVSNGVITAVNVTNGGSNYTFADVTVNSGTGSGARLAPVIESGVIQNINVYDGGTGYSGSDTVSITNDPHDTLYLTQMDASPANLDLGNLTATTVFTNDIKVHSGDLTLHPTVIFNGGIKSSFNPTTDNTYGLGSGSHAWQGVVAYTIYADDYYSKTGGDATFHCSTLAPNGSTISITGDKYFIPATANNCSIGTGTYYFKNGYFNNLRYKSLASFDALDDLALAKSYKTKTIIYDKVEQEVIDPECLPFLKAEKTDQNDETFFDAGKVNGFLLGCIKRLIEEVDTLKTRISGIENQKREA